MASTSRASTPSGLAAVCCLAIVPWVGIQNAGGDLTFVMSWGLLNTNPWHTLWLTEYAAQTHGFAAVPRSLQFWPFALGFYAGAAVSAASGVVAKREDPRITAGLLVLSAVGSLFVWQEFVASGFDVAVPFGAIATVVVVWWFYWPAVRELGVGGRPPE